jgi:hypothetical protein
MCSSLLIFGCCTWTLIKIDMSSTCAHLFSTPVRVVSDKLTVFPFGAIGLGLGKRIWVSDGLAASVVLAARLFVQESISSGLEEVVHHLTITPILAA